MNDRSFYEPDPPLVEIIAWGEDLLDRAHDLAQGIVGRIRGTLREGVLDAVLLQAPHATSSSVSSDPA